MTGRCAIPPQGWCCSRKSGHEGPCAARPTAELGEELWQVAEQQAAKRAADMPTEQDAIRQMTEAYHRLTELGWRNPIYCPKDGTPFDVVEAGSSGIHRAHYMGDWPDGSWFVEDGGDLWPSRHTLYRPTAGAAE